MPDSDATLGFGSILAYADTEAGPYTEVAQTVDLPMPEPEIGDVKITNNDSPNNAHEYLAGGGLEEPGEFEFDVVYKKSECALLYAMKAARENKWWKETFPDGSYCKFPGYIKKLGGETKTEDDAIHNTITIKLTTAATYTASS
jgi:hypothetical protein